MFSKEKFSVQQIKKMVQTDYFILFVIGTLYTVIISVLSISRHDTFLTNTWDLGIYSQSLYSTVNHGKILYYTAELTGNPSGSLFGIHFLPFLLLLTPIYAIFQNPVILLILRPIAISIGLIPLYWIIKDHQINNRILTIFIAIVYVIYPPMTAPLSNFDLEVFLPALFLFSIHYLRKGKLYHSYFFAVLALMVNEFVPLIIMTMSVYVALRYRKEIFNGLRAKKLTKHAIFAATLLVTALAVFSLASVVITSFNPNALGTKWEWGELGSSPGEIVRNVLTNPGLASRMLLNNGQSKFLYVTALFAPLAFLSFLEPLTLIMTVPWLAASLLSVNTNYYTIGTQYPAFISAFIFISAISGVKKVANISGKEMLNKLAFLMGVILVLSIFLLPTGEYFVITDTDESIRLALNEIGSTASVSTMPGILPHVCDRLNAYPYFKSDVDYVLINVYSWWYTVTLPRPAHLAPTWSEVDLSDDYGLVINANGVLLYEKGYNGSLEYFEGIDFRYTCPGVYVATGEVVEENVTIGNTFLRDKEVLVHNDSHETPLFFKIPERNIPPGYYTVTARFKVASITPDEQIRIEVLNSPGNSEIFSTTINGTDFIMADRWQKFTFSFSIEEPTRVEYAIYLTGATNVTWYSFDVLQVTGGI